MREWGVHVYTSGAVQLGPDVVCDGFLHGVHTRVQTHIHADHLIDFDTSKGYQDILASHASRDLLLAMRNADLPYRQNFRAIDWAKPQSIENGHLRICPSGHILGAAQVEVSLLNSPVLGYSGDFQWPMKKDDVVRCDILVLDSTHGNPRYKRRYKQDQVEAELIELLLGLVRRKLVIVRGHTGALLRIMTRISGHIDVPLAASKATLVESRVYRKYGYPAFDLVDYQSEYGAECFEAGTGIVFLKMHEKPPELSRPPAKVMLSGYISDPKEPVLEFNEDDYRVALSDHADFEGILEYVRATGAKKVLTDNSRGGHGVELAKELRRSLNIDAKPSNDSSIREWGRGKT